ncbi:unnamed protein product, partial [Discosporangium mesarthrocarpum]
MCSGAPQDHLLQPWWWWWLWWLWWSVSRRTSAPGGDRAGLKKEKGEDIDPVPRSHSYAASSISSSRGATG